MSTETQQTIPESVDTARTQAPSALLTAFMQHMIRKIDCGEILLQIPGGQRFLLKGKRAGERAHVVLHHWKCMLRLLASVDLGFAEGYLAGEWSTPNIYSFLSSAGRRSNDTASFEGLKPPQPLNRFRHTLNRNTRRGSRRNIAAHYDLGNDFYQFWLASSMTYSSAIYSSPDQTLEDAQRAKLDCVIDLLGLAEIERQC